MWFRNGTLPPSPLLEDVHSHLAGEEETELSGCLCAIQKLISPNPSPDNTTYKFPAKSQAGHGLEPEGKEEASSWRQVPYQSISRDRRPLSPEGGGERNGKFQVVQRTRQSTLGISYKKYTEGM